MKIILNANYDHIVNSNFQQSTISSAVQQRLKELFIENLKEKGEYENSTIVWKDDKNVEVSGISAIALHSFVLEAEKLGKNVRFEKKTIIEIID